jgi:hypothetical protein
LFFLLFKVLLTRAAPPINKPKHSNSQHKTKNKKNIKVRIATFSQHHVDGLDLALCPLAIMVKAYAPALQEQGARAHLGRFGIGGPLALQPLYTLSGGQKSRVALAKLTYTQPHILLLDEVCFCVYARGGFVCVVGGVGKRTHVQQQLKTHPFAHTQKSRPTTSTWTPSTRSSRASRRLAAAC